MSGGNNEICPDHQAMIVDPVMMDKRSPRRFGDADAFALIRPGAGAYLGVEDVRVIQNPLHHLDAEDDLNQPGVVIMEGTQDGPALNLAEFGPFLIGDGRAAMVYQV